MIAVPEVTEVGEPVVTDAARYSPTLPAFALSFVVVPTMPAVLEGVNVPVLLNVVKAPVLAAVLPIGPGEAKRFTNPVPLTVDDADSVVNAPVLAAVEPIAGGDANKEVNPAPLTVLLADRVVKAPVDAVVEPTGPGEANVAPPSVEALIVVLQDSPVEVVQFNALEVVLQLGIEIAVGDATDPVALARIVLAVCVANSVNGTDPAGSVTVLEADNVVKEPDEPLMGVPVMPVALIPPVNVAPASGAYRANWPFNSAAVRICPGVNCAEADTAHINPTMGRNFFMLVCSYQG